jgi:hypothetical protein
VARFTAMLDPIDARHRAVSSTRADCGLLLAGFPLSTATTA